MLTYKLYLGGYRDIQGVTIAKDGQEAEKNLREDLRLHSLPCEFSEVVLKDHVIMRKPKISEEELAETSKEEPFKEEDKPEKAPKGSK